MTKDQDSLLYYRSTSMILTITNQIVLTNHKENNFSNLYAIQTGIKIFNKIREFIEKKLYRKY